MTISPVHDLGGTAVRFVLDLGRFSVFSAQVFLCGRRLPARMRRVLDEMFNVRLNLTDAALAEMPALKRALHRIQTLRTISKDRICLITPELAGLATPFADR